MNTLIRLLLILPALSTQASLAAVTDIFPDLAETQSITDSTTVGIDPSALTLTADATVTVYFISEGAGYQNSFGWYDASTDPTSADNRNTVWANASGTGEGLAGGGSLDSGTAVEIGTFEAGTELGFFLVANGNQNPDGYIYTTDANYNPDGLAHLFAGLLPEEGLLAIGFEDLYGGGDNDFNDLIIAIDIGVENALAIAAAAPEPEVILLLILGLAFLKLRERLQLG